MVAQLIAFAASGVTDASVIIDAAHQDGNTPLYVACQNQHEAVVQLLLRANANVNACRNDGNSPLLIASEVGATEITKHLIEARANVNRRYEPSACERGREACLRAEMRVPDTIRLREPDASVEHRPCMLRARMAMSTWCGSWCALVPT